MKINDDIKLLFNQQDWDSTDKTIDEVILNLMQESYAMGVADSSGKKPINCFKKSGVLHKQYECIRDAKIDGFDPKSIRLCISGKQPLHKGFKFELAK